jgi:CHAD domain-containing protein
MEVEAKFTVPNRQVYRALMRLHALGDYVLLRAGTVRVVDRYFDTQEGCLLAAGYACRLRSHGDEIIATLKALGGAEGAVHRREELEVRLPVETLGVSEWPEGPARTRALALTAGADLCLLFELDQTRVLSDVTTAERTVGQLSLDTVRARVGRRPALYYEAELELGEQGTEEDLTALVRAFPADWGLVPEPRSKFERALAALRAPDATPEERVTSEERTGLQAYADGEDGRLATRATVVLGWADGLPTREIAARSGLSRGRVRYWVRAFRAERMGIFGRVPAARHLEIAQPQNLPLPEQAERTLQTVAGRSMAEAPAGQAAPQGGRVTELVEPGPGEEAPPLSEKPPRQRGVPTVSEFCRQHGVDMMHARFVANQALALFDALRAVHGTPRKRKRLLRQAALLHTVGMAEGADRHYRVGRDLILAQPLRNVSTADRLALACIIAFHRNKVQPDREPTMAALDGKLRPQVLSLTALLHIAEALDSSRTQSTLISEVRGADASRCEVRVAGPAAEADAVQAAGRADLWYRLFDQELVVSPLEERLPEGTGAADEAIAIGPDRAWDAAITQVAGIQPMSGEEPMSEAGRRVLYLHFTRMLANEPGTRLGQDIEALHDMRVATRRMRAAFQVFQPYFERKVLAPFGKGLRRVARTLGAVRDLDVLLQKAADYQATLPAQQAISFEPLRVHWETRREVCRWQMLEYLDSQAYRRFTREFEAFLTTPGAGAVTLSADEPVPYQVRHVVPALILTRYEAVRAYEPIIEAAPLTTYHMLRISFKRFRYVLEFFGDILGAEAPGLIKRVVTMQDLLGELQDAHVAEGLVVGFLDQQHGKHKKRKPMPSLEGVEGYLATLQSVQRELLERFPGPWVALTGPQFRRDLALAVAAL